MDSKVDSKESRRIIAIAVSPAAYDEIHKLKGKEKWTSFTLKAVIKLVGGNKVLESEVSTLSRKTKPAPKAGEYKAEILIPQPEQAAGPKATRGKAFF